VALRTTSVDTISSLQTEDGVNDLSLSYTEEEDEDYKPKESSAAEIGAAGATDSLNSSISDPGCSSSSRSSSSSGNRDDGDELDDQSLEEFLLSNKEITSNPSKLLMMQRFLAHFRNNPNDPHLQHFLSLLLSGKWSISMFSGVKVMSCGPVLTVICCLGPEYAPPRLRLRHITNISDAARLLR